ncbi:MULTISPECIES: hypothetical protein [unclassified Nostoc]|uniref:hypothetical protein n=1 Tax=unclassified Nostoc TaxID=2593658 RepID=UPI002608D127|nr:hypothetical protein [Nostoc sp. S13]MDF5736069.1 hypothetical protein [Nostoc sp. S13]
MLSNQNFDNNLEGLQHDYSILIEKINRLGSALAIETDVTRSLQYEQLLKQAKEKREELDWQIRQIKNQQLYYLLQRLDYTEQEQLFSRFIRRQQIAAFMIHGCSQDYGQHWLANRLLKEIRRVSDRPVLVDLDCLVYNPNSQTMWRELGRHFGEIKDSPDLIAEKVFKSWTTKNIYIVVDNVEFMGEQLLQELIQEFWLPLATKAQSVASQTNFKLLMFLIDNESFVESQSWNVSFAEIFEQTWSCYIPVKLPILKLFSDTALRDWINREFVYLPDQLVENIDQVIQTILKNSEAGMPIPAFREICNLCECEWLEEWLKIC